MKKPAISQAAGNGFVACFILHTAAILTSRHHPKLWIMNLVKMELA